MEESVGLFTLIEQDMSMRSVHIAHLIPNDKPREQNYSFTTLANMSFQILPSIFYLLSYLIKMLFRIFFFFLPMVTILL